MKREINIVTESLAQAWIVFSSGWLLSADLIYAHSLDSRLVDATVSFQRILPLPVRFPSCGLLFKRSFYSRKNY